MKILLKKIKHKTVTYILHIFTNSWNSVTMNPRVYPLDDIQYKFQIPIVSQGKRKRQLQ